MDKTKKDDKKQTTSKLKSWFGSNKDPKKAAQPLQTSIKTEKNSPPLTVSRRSTVSTSSPKVNAAPLVENLKENEKKEAGTAILSNVSMPSLGIENPATTNLTRKSSIDRLKAFMHIGNSNTSKSIESSESKHSRRDSRTSLRQLYSADVDSKENVEFKIEAVQPESQIKPRRPSNVNPSPLGLAKSPSTPSSPRTKTNTNVNNSTTQQSNGVSSNHNVYEKINDLEKKVLYLENYIAAIVSHEKANIILAATCIQRVYRGYKARQIFKFKKGMKLYGTSQYPLDIDSLHTLHSFHYKPKDFLKSKTNKDVAATKIQGLVVNYLLRYRLRILIKQNKAAIKIQSAWRGYSVRYIPKTSYPPLRSLIHNLTNQSRAIQYLSQQLNSLSSSPKPKPKLATSSTTRTNLRSIHTRSNTVGSDSKTNVLGGTGSLNESRIRKKSLTMDSTTFASPTNSDRKSPNIPQSRIPQLKDSVNVSKLHHPRSQSTSFPEFTSRIAKPGTIAGTLNNGPPNSHPSIRSTRVSSKLDTKNKLLEVHGDSPNHNVTSSPTSMSGYVTMEDYEYLKAEVEFLREAFDKLMASKNTP